MKNYFTINISENLGELSTEETEYILTDNLSLKLANSGSCQIIDNDRYFYFRFGIPLKNNSEPIDLEMAENLLNGKIEALTENNGYFLVFFFNKSKEIGNIFADRIGVHKTYFQYFNDSLRISNQSDDFDFNDINVIDKDWLAEMINFKICAGSNTYNPTIKQLPAGQYYSFDSTLKPTNAGFYWEVLDRIPYTDITLEDATEQSLKLLNSHLAGTNIKNKRVAVLLSGGVDSSLLTALTKEQNNSIIAITPVFTSGENPELAAAIAMAKSINVEHQIIEINDIDIANEFSNIVNFLKQPIRSPQTIIFSILMREFKGKFDAVVFGEGADMIFGYHAVLQAAKRYEKHCKVAFLKPLTPLLKPFKSITPVSKLLSLINEPVSAQVTNSWAIEYSTSLKKMLPNVESISNRMEVMQWLKLSEHNYKNLDITGFKNLVRRFIIQESCMYHFYTMGAIANRDGIELICPFFDADVVKYATNFDDKLYFGDQFTKPILRKLSEKFYNKEIIYAKKKGFPVPHKSWLNGPLQKQAEQAKEFIRTNFDNSATEEHEFVWLVMALQELDIVDTLNNY
jgi:asparagine synthase (glutamine-hydrolysing)